MKLVLCTDCGDIVVPSNPTGPVNSCKCGRHTVWWENPLTGDLRVYDRDRRPSTVGSEMGPRVTFTPPACFVIGLANNWLTTPEEHLTAADYQALIDEIPASYIFKTVRSVAIRFRVGASGDTRYADKFPEWASIARQPSR